MRELTKTASILDTLKSEERKTLTEVESKNILEEIGVETPEYYLATTAEEAVKFAEKIGYPVVLKIVSPEITHKSDANGVLLDLQDTAAVHRAFTKIVKNASNYNPNASIIGVSIQKMISDGIEVIVGMKRDEKFGPVLLFGLGGVFVELLKDVSLKILPVADIDLTKMFNEIKGNAILKGYRNTSSVDLEKIKKIIKKIAQLSIEYPEISEMELNPVRVQENSNSAIALDARIIIQ